jgi:hypothetical protein
MNFLAAVYGLRSRSGPMSEPFWLATMLLVWLPFLTLVVLAAAQLPRWVGTGAAYGNGMRFFGVILLGVLAGLGRVPPPRFFRWLGLPALLAAAGGWLLS